MKFSTNGFGVSGGHTISAAQAPWVAYVVFIVFGLVGFGVFVLGINMWNNAEATRAWPSVQGSVVSSEVTTHRSQSRSSSNRGSTSSVMYGAEVVYKYVYNGEEFRSNRIGSMAVSSSDYGAADRMVRRYAPGTPVKVFVNTKDPSEGILTPGAGWGEIILIVLGAVFSLIGDGGLVWLLLKNKKTDAAAAANAAGDGLSRL